MCVCVSKGKFVVLLRLIFKTFSSKRKRRDDHQQGRLHLKLRKTGEGNWQGERVALRLKKTSEGLWEADESVMDRMMDPRNDMPEFDASFLKLIHPATRKSRRERKNIPDDVPTPPPTSSSEDDCFRPVKKTKRVLRKKK